MTRLAEVVLFLFVVAAGAVFVRLMFNLWHEVSEYRRHHRGR